MSGLQSQMRQRDVEMVPLVLVRSMFGLMVAALALTSFAVLTGRPPVGVAPPSPVAAEVTVRLLDEGEGVAAVVDREGNVIARSDENRAGFLGVMQRVVATERQRHGLGDEAPVRVLRREDGRIELIDDTTGWSADLMGNGRDNVAAFARLVP
jgi:putative photosynthetic complex assembly protein